MKWLIKVEQVTKTKKEIKSSFEATDIIFDDGVKDKELNWSEHSEIINNYLQQLKEQDKDNRCYGAESLDLTPVDILSVK